ncbi:hypothetical protein LINPERPRIM_LOCUS23813 [Linum perenne]
MSSKGKRKQVSKQCQSFTHPSDIGDAPIDIDHSKFIISEVRHKGISNNCWVIATAVVVEAFVNQQRHEIVVEYLSAAPQYLIDYILTPGERVRGKHVTRIFRATPH